MKTKKELTSEELAVLDSSYPVSEDSSNRLTLPRFGMLSKDITETTGTGKNKKVVVVQAAGMFYTEKDQGDTDKKTGKKIWTKDFFAEEAEVIIAFERKQLRKYDEGLKKYISTPMYDNRSQVLPLYLDKRVMARGTAEYLQSLYPTKTAKGKPTSSLEEETILFVIYKDELHQLTLSKSSKFEFKDYKSGLNPSTVLTLLKGSEDRTKGSNVYKATLFSKVRNITQEELDQVKEFQALMKDKVESDAKYFLANAENKQIEAGSTKALDDYGNEKME